MQIDGVHMTQTYPNMYVLHYNLIVTPVQQKQRKILDERLKFLLPDACSINNYY